MPNQIGGAVGRIISDTKLGRMTRARKPASEMRCPRGRPDVPSEPGSLRRFCVIENSFRPIDNIDVTWNTIARSRVALKGLVEASMLVHGSDLRECTGSPTGEPLTNDHRRRDRPLVTSSTPTWRAPQRERLQHRTISECIVREYFWINGHAVAWLKWA